MGVRITERQILVGKLAEICRDIAVPEGFEVITGRVFTKDQDEYRIIVFRCLGDETIHVHKYSGQQGAVPKMSVRTQGTAAETSRLRDETNQLIQRKFSEGWFCVNTMNTGLQTIGLTELAPRETRVLPQALEPLKTNMDDVTDLNF